MTWPFLLTFLNVNHHFIYTENKSYKINALYLPFIEQ